MPTNVSANLYDEFQSIQHSYNKYTHFADALKLIQTCQNRFKTALNTKLSTKDFNYTVNQIINLDYMNAKLRIHEIQHQIIGKIIHAKNVPDSVHYLINHLKPLIQKLQDLKNRIKPDVLKYPFDTILSNNIQNSILIKKNPGPKFDNLAIHRLVLGFDFLFENQILKISNQLNKLNKVQITNKDNFLMHHYNTGNYEVDSAHQALNWLSNLKTILNDLELVYEKQYRKNIKAIPAEIILNKHLKMTI